MLTQLHDMRMKSTIFFLLNSKLVGNKTKKNQKLVKRPSSITRDIIDSYGDSYFPSSPNNIFSLLFIKCN